MTPLRFASFLAPNMFPVYQYLVDEIGARLGVAATLQVGERLGDLEEGVFDAAFLCGLPYVQINQRRPGWLTPLAAPVLQGGRFAGRPIYFSDVIVRADSPFRAWADLRGRSWSYNDPDSQSGYNITRATLVRRGEVGGFFGRVVRAGYHQRSIQWVAEGVVDASAIDCQVLAIELRDHPELVQQIKVIDTLGPSTIQPLAALSRLPAELRSGIQTVVTGLGDAPAARERLDYGGIDHWAAVTDADYDDIRSMLADVERAGFLELR